MATKIRFERSGMMSAAHLSEDDTDGTAFVFCAIPGGTPQFQVSRESRYATPVANAPQCETHKDFVRFVRERFANDA